MDIIKWGIKWQRTDVNEPIFYDTSFSHVIHAYWELFCIIGNFIVIEIIEPCNIKVTILLFHFVTDKDNYNLHVIYE